MDDPNAGVAPTPTPTPAPTTEPAAPAAEPIAEPTPAPAAPAEEPTTVPQAPVAEPTPVSEPAVTPAAEPAPAVTPAPTTEPAAPAAASVLGQAPAPAPGQPAPAAGKKMSTGLIIGLIAGGLAVVVGLILLFVLVIPAISGPSGKYEIVSYTRSGATYNKEYFDKYDEHLYIDFKGDGKCTVTMKSSDRERSYDCTYGNGKFSSDSLSTESNTLNMKSSGNQVILEDDEYKYVFEK